MDRRIPAGALALLFAATGVRALPEHKPVDSTYERDVKDKYDNNIEQITHVVNFNVPESKMQNMSLQTRT